MNGEAVALQPCMSTTQTDEAWHVLDGELTFRYADRTEGVGPGTTGFVPAGTPHTYSAGAVIFAGVFRYSGIQNLIFHSTAKIRESFGLFRILHRKCTRSGALEAVEPAGQCVR
jgi:hypothetical protein